jgi:hypothetical protein|tara:strand:- start:1002 stop:1571 length:570 start_codon:yes stop_codon:yes gene_type:complete
MKSFKEVYKNYHSDNIREDLDEIIKYANKNNIPVHNVYRPHSDAYYELTKQLSEKINHLPDVDKLTRTVFEETDLGKWEKYEGELVPLDLPLVEAEYNGREVELEKPRRGGSKKFYVYVKNDKGNVIKVEYGDVSGLNAKINDRDKARSFSARHNCPSKKDKTKPGYWSCRLPMYAKELGLQGGGNYFW